MSSHMKWWEEARFGMFIHWGLYAIPARGEWVRNIEKYRDEDYRAYAGEFNPVNYAPREWARVAKQAGMKYVVMTAKHHDGFCLFDSKLTEFKATNTPAKRDLVREYVEGFRAEGLKVGFYYSLLDWNHPHYPVDRLHPRREDAEAKAKPRDFSKYLDYLHGQVRELMTNYGRIDLLWVDFSYDEMTAETWRATELIKMVRSLQPTIIINNRLGVHGSGQLGDFNTPEQTVPEAALVDADGKALLWETCMTVNNNWGYARDDHDNKSPALLVRTLVECVSKNGNMLLNVGPTAKGEIPQASVERLEAVGRWMRANGESIYGAGAADLPKPDWGRYTRRGNVIFAHLLDKPAGVIALKGLGGKIKRARLLHDGSEVNTSKPWNVWHETEDAFLTLPGSKLPDELDTVISLELQ